MELPKQKKIYGGLETKFTDLKSLTKELKEKNLTGLLKISFDACEGIIFFDDGLIIDGGHSRGLLLPQVPVEWGWNREEFLIHTCRKARLPDYAWRDKGIKIYRFQATIFSEDDIR